MTNEEIEMKAASALYDSSEVAETLEARIARYMRELVEKAYEEAAAIAESVSPTLEDTTPESITASDEPDEVGEKLALRIRALKASLAPEPVSSLP